MEVTTATKPKKVSKFINMTDSIKNNGTSILSTLLAITILLVNLGLSIWVLYILNDDSSINVGRADIVKINELNYEVVREDRMKRLTSVIDTTPVVDPFVQR
jgi:hypothetical protein